MNEFNNVLLLVLVVKVLVLVCWVWMLSDLVTLHVEKCEIDVAFTRDTNDVFPFFKCEDPDFFEYFNTGQGITLWKDRTETWLELTENWLSGVTENSDPPKPGETIRDQFEKLTLLDGYSHSKASYTILKANGALL